MSVAITIQLSPSAIAIAQKWKGAPQEFPQAVKRGMDRALQIVSGRIQLQRLTGHGPFPVEQHRLGERTGQLKLRTRATPATVEGTTVTGAIGSSVKYAAVHEFGYDGEVPTRSYTRHQKSRDIKKGGKLVASGVAFAFPHELFRHMHIPERAPFRTGINENAQYISDEISKECVNSLKT